MSSSHSDGGSRSSQKLKSSTSPSTALMAVALQDHLTKQYSLSLTAPLPKRRLQQPSAPPLSSGCNRCGCHPHRTKHKVTSKQQLPLSINTDVLALNSNGDSREMVRPCPVKLDRTSLTSKQEIERVLDKSPPPLTLAQRMGLVQAPPTLLSGEEWAKLKGMSKHRNDSASPCPICQEPFRLSQQVLLSCSHVFHLSCLRSLERFSGCKRCPMCRRENYQKRIIYEGAHYYRHWAATVIQSIWRGYAVRKWYNRYRDVFPPRHPTLRRKHFERRLEKLTAALVQSCSDQSSGAECVLAESDRAVESARNAMRILECTLADSASFENWCGAYSKAKEHVMSECPVCLTGLCPATRDPTHQPRPISILSCGHLFHMKCIESLEHHCHANQDVHLCPLCRSPYLRQLYVQ